jgi:hypothetical protein
MRNPENVAFPSKGEFYSAMHDQVASKTEVKLVRLTSGKWQTVVFGVSVNYAVP